MYTAACLCGAVRIEITQDIQQIFICHCKECQKAQGGAFVAVTTISVENFHITSGHQSVDEFYSSKLKKRVFCRNCASPLYSARIDLPDVIRLRVGIVDQPLEAKIYSHAFVEEKVCWFEITGNALQFNSHI